MDRDPQFVASDARALLDNPAWKAIWRGLSKYLDVRELSCDSRDRDTAQDIIRTRQLLAGLQREVQRLLDDGHISSIKLAELEKRRLPKIFQR